MRSHFFKSAQIAFLMRHLRRIYKRAVSVGVGKGAVGDTGDHSFGLDQLIPTTIHLQHQA